jgi:hypothetical protein
MRGCNSLRPDLGGGLMIRRSVWISLVAVMVSGCGRASLTAPEVRCVVADSSNAGPLQGYAYVCGTFGPR